MIVNKIIILGIATLEYDLVKKRDYLKQEEEHGKN